MTKTKPKKKPVAELVPVEAQPIKPASIPVSESTDLVVLASQPGFDTEKLKLLIELKNQQQDREAERSFLAALSDCQAELPTIIANSKNTHIGNKYADMNAIHAAIQPVYTKHGFSVQCSEDVDKSQGNLLRIYIIVGHRAGHTVRREGNFPIDTSGAAGKTNKTEIQGRGSAMTYGERYLTCKFFGVRIADDVDNDGNAPKEVATPEQIEEINTLIGKINSFASTPINMTKFLDWLGVESLDKLSQAGVAKAVCDLNRNLRNAYREKQEQGK